MLRVVGGTLRGRSFAMPEKGVRPTANRVREALFNILGQDMNGKRVLDLFAGSGALGIESLSRGAELACFVEKNARHARVIKKNLKLLDLETHSELHIVDARQVLQKNWPQRFDVIFADPPYAELPEPAFWFGLLQNMLRPDGVLVVEHASRDNIVFEQLIEKTDEIAFTIERRRYGDSSLTLFYRHTGNEAHSLDKQGTQGDLR